MNDMDMTVIFNYEIITLLAMAFSTGVVFHLIFNSLYGFVRTFILGAVFFESVSDQNERLKKYNRMLKDDMREEIESRDEIIKQLNIDLSLKENK